MRWLFGLLLSGTAFSQSVSVSTPAANATIAGTYTLSCSVASISNLARVEYVVDELTVQVVDTPIGDQCPPYVWSTQDEGNGVHLIRVRAYDALNNVLADSCDVSLGYSCGVSFTIDNLMRLMDNSANTQLQPGCVPATAITSSWSSHQTITCTPTGTGSVSSWYLTVDGQIANYSNGGAAQSFDTRNYYNSTHLVSMMAYTSTAGTPQLVGSWTRKVTFANATQAVELITSAAEHHFAPAGTYTWTGTIHNADGSTTATSPLCHSEDTAVVTNSGNGCAFTAGATVPATGQVVVMAPTNSQTDMNVDSGTATRVYSNASPGGGFQPYEVGNWMYISTNTGGWTAGWYKIIGVSNCGTFGDFCGADLNASPAAVGTTGGSFQTGPTAEPWAFVNSQNVVPHFSRIGEILTSYNPVKSIFSAGLFSTSGAFTYSNWVNDLVASGWTTIQVGAECSAPSLFSVSGIFTSCGSSAANQAAWEASQDAVISYYASLIAGKQVYMSLFDTGFYGQDTDLFNTTRGLGTAYSTNWLTTFFNKWTAANACTPSATQHCYGSVLYAQQMDEPTRAWPGIPIPGGTFGSTNGPTSIVASGGTCTINYGTNAVGGGSFNVNGVFLITGATTTALNNVYPASWSSGSTGNISSSFTFTCGGVADGTYNASNNPSLTVQPFGSWESMTDYIHYDAFSQIAGWTNANGIKTSWNTRGLDVCQTVKNWQANSTLSQFAMLYNVGLEQQSDGNLGPNQTGIWGRGLYSFYVPQYRAKMGCIQDGVPVGMIATAITSLYDFTGYSTNPQTNTAFTVVSFVGDTITTSAPHGLANVNPLVTRVVVAGQSTSGDNGNYYVRATPTATTIQVIKAPSGTDTNGVTLTFANGHSWTADLSNASAPANGYYIGACHPADFGVTFTTNSGNWPGTYYYSPASDPTCGGGPYQIFHTVPTASSTGGTVSIIPDNYGHSGYTAATQRTGLKPAYLSQMLAYILGASMISSYAQELDPQLRDPSNNHFSSITFDQIKRFNGYDVKAANNQRFTYAPVNNFGSKDMWYTTALPNLVMQRDAKFLFQPILNRSNPDFGDGFLATARGDGGSTYGNILVIQNFWDWTRSLTVDLTPYELPGKAIWRRVCELLKGCTYTSIAAGTMMDTYDYPANGTATYLFSANPTTEVPEPAIAVRLADIPNATKVIARWAYTTYPLNQSSALVLNNVADLGSGSGTLPADLTIGPVSYVLQYLDTGGKILATGAVQTLPQQ